MCIIIDASVAATFFTEPFRGDNKPIADWITRGFGTLIYGGQLRAELFKIGAAKSLVLNWSRAGLAVEVAVSADVRRSGQLLDPLPGETLSVRYCVQQVRW